MSLFCSCFGRKKINDRQHSLKYNAETIDGELIPILALRNILKSETSNDINYLQWRNVCQNWNNIITYYNDKNLTLFYLKFNGVEEWSFSYEFNIAIDFSHELGTSNIIRFIKLVWVQCISSDLNYVIEQLNDKLSTIKYDLNLFVKCIDTDNESNELNTILSLKDYLPNCNVNILCLCFNNENHNMQWIANMIRFLTYNQKSIFGFGLIGIKYNYLSSLINVDSFNYSKYSLKSLVCQIRFDDIFHPEIDETFAKITEMFPNLSAFCVGPATKQPLTMDISDSYLFSPKWIPKLSTLSKWKYLHHLALTLQCSPDHIRQQIYDMNRMEGNLSSLKSFAISFQMSLQEDNGKIVCEVLQIFESSAPNISIFQLLITGNGSCISSIYLNQLIANCPRLIKSLTLLKLAVPELINGNNMSERIRYHDALLNLFQYSISLECFWLDLGQEIIEGNQSNIVKILPRSISDFKISNSKSYAAFPLKMKRIYGWIFDRTSREFLSQLDSEMEQIIESLNQLKNPKLSSKIQIDIPITFSHAEYEHSCRFIFNMFSMSIKKYNGQSQLIIYIITNKVSMKFNWKLDDGRERELIFIDFLFSH